MANEDLELRARLRITDESGEALRRAAGEVEHVSHEADEAKEHMGFLEHAMSNFAAIELGEVVAHVREMGAEFLHAADEADAADQAVGALIATAQDRGFADARQEAGQLREELDKVAIDAHQATSAVSGAFQQMLEITGATEQGVEKASDATNQLSQIATLLGKDVSDVAGEFSMMSEGVVRTRGQLFHLLNTTGIFGDKIKKASAGWATLTEEERARRLTYALEQLSKNAEEAEPTFAQVRTTISDIVEQIEEGLGRPLLDAINPEMRRFAEELRRGLPAIEEFGKEMSVDVARWVHEAAEAVQEGFDYLRSHGKEIHDDIVEAVGAAKKVVEFILDHKEAIAIAFGAKAGLGIAGGLAKTAVESPLGGLLGKGLGGILTSGAQAGAFGVKGVAGAGLAGGATAAAALAWYEAGTQLAKLWDETAGDTRQTFDAVREGMKDMAGENTKWTDVEVDAFQRMRANLLESAQYLGEDVGAAVQFADALERSHAAHVKNMEFVDSLEQMSHSFEVIALSAQMGIDSAKTAAEQAAAIKEQQEFESGGGAQIVEQFSSGFEQLMAAHDTAAQQYVAHLLAGSKNLFASFLQSAQMSDEGFRALADAVEAGGSEFADQAKAIRDLIGSKEHQKMQVHFNMPGAHITVQQDFRDQDPDNVALVFKRDLVHAAVNKLGSGFSVPFGA